MQRNVLPTNASNYTWFGHAWPCLAMLGHSWPCLAIWPFGHGQRWSWGPAGGSGGARDWELFSKSSSQLRLVELGKQHNTTAQFLKLSATTRAVHLTSTVQHIMFLWWSSVIQKYPKVLVIIFFIHVIQTDSQLAAFSQTALFDALVVTNLFYGQCMPTVVLLMPTSEGKAYVRRYHKNSKDIRSIPSSIDVGTCLAKAQMEVVWSYDTNFNKEKLVLAKQVQN